MAFELRRGFEVRGPGGGSWGCCLSFETRASLSASPCADGTRSLTECSFRPADGPLESRDGVGALSGLGSALAGVASPPLSGSGSPRISRVLRDMSSSAAGVSHSSILKATVPKTFAAKDLWSLLVGSSTMVKPGVAGRFSESDGRRGLADLALSFLSPFTVIVLLLLRAGVGGTPLVPLVFGDPGRP